MPKQDLYIGLGNLVYAITQSGDNKRTGEIPALRDVLAQEVHGDIAYYSFQFRKIYKSNAEDAYRSGMRRLQDNKRDFDQPTRMSFMRILRHVASACPGAPPPEAWLERCQHDIERV